MVFSTYKKLRIVSSEGSEGTRDWKKRLFQEGMMASIQGIHKFIKCFEATGLISRKQGSGHFEATGSISRKQGRGRLSKVMEVVKAYH